jgi:hypothetical protein
MIRFDHLKLARRDWQETGRFVSWLKDRAAEGAGVWDLAVLHEADRRCCRKEPWPATLARLLPERALAVFAVEAPPDPERN